jgi:hypothetical protein
MMRSLSVAPSAISSEIHPLVVASSASLGRVIRVGISSFSCRPGSAPVWGWGLSPHPSVGDQWQCIAQCPSKLVPVCGCRWEGSVGHLEEIPARAGLGMQLGRAVSERALRQPITTEAAHRSGRIAHPPRQEAVNDRELGLLLRDARRAGISSLLVCNLFRSRPLIVVGS